MTDPDQTPVPPGVARAFAVASDVFDLVGRVVLWFSGIGLVTMTLIIGWHVFARRVLNDTPDWSETSSVLIMFWYSLLGAAIGVRYQMHIGLVFVRDRLPPAVRLVVDVIINLVVAAVGLLLVWYGIKMVQFTWNQPIPTVGLPVGLRYLPFPIGGALIATFAIEILLRTLSGREVKRTWS